MGTLLCLSVVCVRGFYECFIIVKISVRFQNSGAWPDSLSNLYSERVSRVISEAGRSWPRFPHSGAWSHSLSNPYSERVFRLIPEPGRPVLDFLISGPGQILYQILTQNGSPGSFRGLGASGLDFRIPGPGQILYQILTQHGSPGLFRSLGVLG